VREALQLDSGQEASALRRGVGVSEGEVSKRVMQATTEQDAQVEAARVAILDLVYAQARRISFTLAVNGLVRALASVIAEAELSKIENATDTYVGVLRCLVEHQVEQHCAPKGTATA